MSFSWLASIWSGAAMMAAALAAIQLVLWLEGERRPVVLLTLLMAVGAGCGAALELALMNASSTESYATLVRYQNVAVYVLLVSMTWFVYLQLASPRRWLVLAISALWSLCLVINFSVSGSLTFAEVHALQPLRTFWGETFTSHEATAGPFKWISDVASLLIIVFVADAMIHAWRSGNRHKAVTVGGSVLLFIVTALLHTVLVDAGYVATPYMISLAFVAIVVALSYDVVRDAARSTRYARRLRRDERRWTLLLNSVQLAVVGIDNEARVSYVNPFFSTTTGIPLERLRGTPASQLFAPGSLPVVHQAADDEARHIPVIRRPVRCANGGTRTLDWRQVELETSDGKPDGMLLVGLDVSEQLEADQELARTRYELERVARANTLGELSAALAHELNQPLAAILSNAQAALRFLKWDPPDHAEVERILVDIVRDDGRAADVIRRLRSMLRNEPSEPELLSLNDAVADAAAIMASEVDARAATLDTSLAAGLPAVLAGRVEMRQVVINLLLNGLQAMDGLPPGQRIIEVTSECSEGDVRLVVRDHGPGIDAQRQQQVFAPFATTRNSGLGMGLAICRRIVENHRGRIEVDNHPDGGARFTVSLAAQPAEGMAKRA